MTEPVRVSELRAGVRIPVWEGTIQGDSADPEHDHLATIFDTDKPIVGIYVSVHEPLAPERFHVYAFLADEVAGEPVEIVERSGSNELVGRVLSSLFKRADLRMTVGKVEIDPDLELPIRSVGEA